MQITRKTIFLFFLLLFGGCEKIAKVFFTKEYKFIQEDLKKEIEFSIDFIKACGQSKCEKFQDRLDSYFFKENEKKVFIQNLGREMEKIPISTLLEWNGNIAWKNNFFKEENGRQTFYGLGIGDKKKDKIYFEVVLRSNPNGEITIIGLNIFEKFIEHSNIVIKQYGPQTVLQHLFKSSEFLSKYNEPSEDLFEKYKTEKNYIEACIRKNCPEEILDSNHFSEVEKKNLIQSLGKFMNSNSNFRKVDRNLNYNFAKYDLDEFKSEENSFIVGYDKKENYGVDFYLRLNLKKELGITEISFKEIQNKTSRILITIFISQNKINDRFKKLNSIFYYHDYFEEINSKEDD